MNSATTFSLTFNRSIPFILGILVLVTGLGMTHASVIESGHSALWFDPDRSGEGWVLEMLSEEHALVYWYTYDDQGNQRWLQGIGAVASDEQGEYLDFSELYITRGGRFGPDFNPDDVEIEIVGEAEMRFSDCNHGSFSYSAFDQSQVIEIQRLTKTMAAGCAPIHGVPGEPVRVYAGQSGTWFDPARDGEGFSMHWLSRDEALVTWYTYDDEGNQRWMVGNGLFVDGKVEFSMIHTTQGGRFGTNFDPDEVELVEWGSLTMELACLEGAAEFESVLPQFGTGGMDLSRLTIIDSLDCPWIRPKLTDLYDITWNEIPLDENGQPTATSIANDGTIAALRRRGSATSEPVDLTIWRPELHDWQDVPEEIGGAVHFSRDARQVLGRLPEGRNEIPAIWSQDSGWQPLPGLMYDESYQRGFTGNFSHIVGYGKNASDNRFFPWIWDQAEGQRELPMTDEIPAGSPQAISNDGRTVVGDKHLIHLADHGVGIVWRDGGDPEFLYSDQQELLGTAEFCNHDCSVIVGYGLAGQSNPNTQVWYKTTSGKFSFLGELPDVANIIGEYAPLGVSSDGSVIVGYYWTRSAEGTFSNRAFVWTQKTGIISIDALFSDIGGGDGHWTNTRAANVSPDGKKVVIYGFYSTDEDGSEEIRRTAVLEFAAKKS